jgi:transposase-like protein
MVLKLRDLYARIPNEGSAFAFLQDRGIMQKRRICANGHAMKASLGNPPRWRCNTAGCRKEVGLRVGTWFANSNIKFTEAIPFIYFWAYEKSSIKFCEDTLTMSAHTVIDYSNFLREVCQWQVEQSQEQIGGQEMTVEIDETLFSKRKNHAGRILPQQWVFGGICRETRETFIVKVPDRSAATLMPIIQQKIRPGTTIISDCWRAYNDVQNQGYVHQRVNHRYNFVDPATGAHTQNIERSWRAAKERNKRQCGTAREMLESYLAEFMWRARLNGRDPFDAILADIAAFMPPQA